MAAMNRQPLLIFKTKSYKPVCMRRFSSTAKAREWLRKEGCRFSNKDLARLGTDSVELVTEEYEYEVEVDIEPEKRRHGQVEK